MTTAEGPAHTVQISTDWNPSNQVHAGDDPFANTMKLLNVRRYQTANPQTQEGLVQRLTLMREAGLPKMRVLPGKVLKELGRIPRSTERRPDGTPYTVDALEELQRVGAGARQMPNVVLAFFSHRWVRPNYSSAFDKDVAWGSEERAKAMQVPGHHVGDPDDAEHSKARALIEWMDWLKWRTHEEMHDGEYACVPGLCQPHLFNVFLDDYIPQMHEDVLFWIDWPCVDQTNPLPEIAALPAFVSACSMIASYWTDEYVGRAWCRAELLVARGFCSLPLVLRVTKGFKHKKQKFASWETHTLPDPRNGFLTDDADRVTIQGLTNCSLKSKAFTYVRVSLAAFIQSPIDSVTIIFTLGVYGLFLTRSVAPGRSKVRLVSPSEERMPFIHRFWIYPLLHPQHAAVMFAFACYIPALVVFAGVLKWGLEGFDNDLAGLIAIVVVLSLLFIWGSHLCRVGRNKASQI